VIRDLQFSKFDASSLFDLYFDYLITIICAKDEFCI